MSYTLELFREAVLEYDKLRRNDNDVVFLMSDESATEIKRVFFRDITVISTDLELGVTHPNLHHYVFGIPIFVLEDIEGDFVEAAVYGYIDMKFSRIPDNSIVIPILNYPCTITSVYTYHSPQQILSPMGVMVKVFCPTDVSTKYSVSDMLDTIDFALKFNCEFSIDNKVLDEFLSGFKKE